MRRFLTLSIVLLLLNTAYGGLAMPLPTGQASPAIMAYLLDSLPLDDASCFRIEGDGVLDFPALVARFPGVPDAAVRLQALGWQQGAYRQFACDAPPSGVGWVDMSVHRFQDAPSAAAAIPFFAQSHALGTQLQPAPATAIGDAQAALAGPVSNGAEYTLYLSRGPLLFRVTGVAPAGDPRPNVEFIAAAVFMDSIFIDQRQTAAVAVMPTARSTSTTTAAYRIEDLGTTDGNWSSATRINAAGDILMTTGTVTNPISDTARDARIWLWHAGHWTDLTALGLLYTIALNDAGVVLARGGSGSVTYDVNTGSLTPLAGFETDAYPEAINNVGTVAGQIGSTAVIAMSGELRSIPVPAGYAFVSPAAINSAKQVAGLAVGRNAQGATDPLTQRAIFFADGMTSVLGPAPGAETSRATDLNDAGWVIGTSGLIGGHPIQQPGDAFLYEPANGTMTDLGTLSGYQNSVARAINNAGQIVGDCWQPANTTDAVRRAFLYDTRTGTMTDLNQLIAPGSGWVLLDAFDINDAGQIVGRGLQGGAMHAFLLTPTG
jgi:probable HAF family extracellular repeat protein